MIHALRVLAVFPILILLVGTRPSSAQSDGPHAEAKQAAQDAAESWLALADADAFNEGWDGASSLLQERVPREEWVQKAERLRDSIQTHSSRSLTAAQYRETLARAPGGPFVILKYRSTFEEGRFEELVLVAREDDEWKVAGYQVSPLPGTPSHASPAS